MDILLVYTSSLETKKKRQATVASFPLIKRQSRLLKLRRTNNIEESE